MGNLLIQKTEYIDLDLKLKTVRPQIREIWNFRGPAEIQNIHIENWRKVFDLNCRKAFKKVRITKKKHMKQFPSEVSNLINSRNNMIEAIVGQVGLNI